jgi:hypothetical protein
LELDSVLGSTTLFGYVIGFWTCMAITHGTLGAGFVFTPCVLLYRLTAPAKLSRGHGKATTPFHFDWSSSFADFPRLEAARASL